ncbi:hypothetical protein QJL30_10460 [Clostridioides difficile]|uniref:Putative DNA-binding protein n=1 Tax=Clostridioides difficile TaxID=1496 RepID=A0A386JC50_CLODI|nr:MULTISPECIES: hypothetical protein [Clostridioides]AYD68761.1 putative DNA-binding protein [Clostridioides difficile]MDI2882253.1 hypothetical protein [Clostridioides difficile]MDI3004363.1 hypothetical protein [Clostridioides difficile]UDN49456.1 hypothetical protein JJJ25_19250 [Clostridioides sp. ES-S-0173-01]HBG7285372.1 hypothetical protein [Clostridioides difficile]
MNRKEFDKLTINEQINYFNQKMSLGLSKAEVCRNLSLPSSTWRDRIKKAGYELDQVNKCYNKINSSNKENPSYYSNTSVIPHDSISINSSESMSPIYEIKKLEKDLRELIENKEDIFKAIEFFKKAEEEKNIVDVIQFKINTENLTGDILVKSFKIYSDVYNKFLEFTEKNKSFKKQDILTQFILDGIQRYSR